MMRQVSRTIGILAALAALSSFGCALTRPVPPPQEINAPFAIRPVGVESHKFVMAADMLIARKAPRWRDHSAEVRLAFGLQNKYGITDRDANGNLYIVIGRPALVLATVEDLAAVLLHEYVHVVYWDYVFNNPSLKDATLACQRARAEMLANKVVVELYHKIGYRHDMLRHQMAMYKQAYVHQQVMECPLEISIDMPSFVRPVKRKGRYPVVPDLGAPDYMTDGTPQEQLEPWDDPNKTEPLYQYQQKPQPVPEAPSDAP